MKAFVLGVVKILLFLCFLIALAGFSAIATIHYIFATSRVEVPDLIGKSVDYATDLLTEQHLKLRLIEQQLDEKTPADHILSQDPSPGSLVKKNQTVRIVTSKGSESTLIPNVVGKPWQQARQLLQQQKFRTGNVAYAHSADIPIDAVIAQMPLPNSIANVGDSIDLLVSRGTYPKIMVMPDLVEQQLSYAVEMIKNMGLVLSKVEHEQYPQVPQNTVLSQVPKPGALIEEHNMVTFVVSQGGQSGRSARVQSPSLQYQTLEYSVPPGQFDRQVSVVVKNAQGTREIYRQIIPPGQQLVVRIPVVGETVVEVYVDGTLDMLERMSAQ
ncbi:PASTA domain containing protein [Candidatus Vecturithrix granuli]|uniref:PASTA domain containing protein n=1 Tax=Vecturithrix granuli TaxID=1499967 RepID=A0A0S6WBU1_VECG1|nr:PASTA domain containing protein [Candidatus Vecturithrix granuli]